MAQKAMEQGLSRDELIALRNKRTGVTIFQISWILVFVCLSVVNLQMRGNFPSWPPPGVDDLSALLPTLATVGLVASGGLAARSVGAMRGGNVAGFFGPWRLTLGLGAAFVLIMAVEWVAVSDTGQFGTIFRVMTAFHAIHALIIGAILWRVNRAALRGAYSAADHWDVEVAPKVWYFVVIAWVLFYIVLYIV